MDSSLALEKVSAAVTPFKKEHIFESNKDAFLKVIKMHFQM